MLDAMTEGISTQEDLFGSVGLLFQLQKKLLEKILDKELDLHLASEKQGSVYGNYWNGKGHKTVKSESGNIPIDTPRDRCGTFEPIIMVASRCLTCEFEGKRSSRKKRCVVICSFCC